MPDRLTKAVGLGNVPVADIVDAPPVYLEAHIVLDVVVLQSHTQ